MAADDRTRLHEIVDRLPEAELALACQLLELLTHGSRALQTDAPIAEPVPYQDGADDDEADEPAASPDTLAKLAQLTDAELLRLDDLLETDREGARQFWRQRFGEELDDDQFADGGGG